MIDDIVEECRKEWNRNWI